MRSVVATFRQHALRASDRMCVSWAMWAATAALSAGNVSLCGLVGQGCAQGDAVCEFSFTRLL